MTSPAQSTMRQKYINGGPGVFISGLVWVIAALVTYMSGFTPGIVTFFVGGMLIHPVSSVADRFLVKTPTPTPDKALMRLSMLTLPLLFWGLYLAYLASRHDQTLFYPIVAVAIGLRYLVFRRIYGLKTFILLGLILIVVGIMAFFANAELILVPFAVGAIELGFGVWLSLQKTIDLKT